MNSHLSSGDSLLTPVAAWFPVPGVPWFISRAENHQQQQLAASSPTKVIAVARKGSSLRYVSMSWHSEKYWRYYSMKGRQVLIARGCNDPYFISKMSVSLLEVTILLWGNVSCIYFRAVIKCTALLFQVSMISSLEETCSSIILGAKKSFNSLTGVLYSFLAFRLKINYCLLVLLLLTESSRPKDRMKRLQRDKYDVSILSTQGQETSLI